MLRSTIQALEVQRGTLAALKSMSNSMNSLAQPGTPQPASADSKPADMSKAFSFAPPAGREAAAPGANGKPASEPPQANADMGNATAFANPAAWWNLLQDQFKQAVSSTLGPDAMQAASAMAQQAGRGEQSEHWFRHQPQHQHRSGGERRRIRRAGE